MIVYLQLLIDLFKITIGKFGYPNAKYLPYLAHESQLCIMLVTRGIGNLRLMIGKIWFENVYFGLQMENRIATITANGDVHAHMIYKICGHQLSNFSFIFKGISLKGDKNLMRHLQ